MIADVPERMKDSAFREYHREGKRLHNNGRDMTDSFDVARLYQIYLDVKEI